MAATMLLLASSTVATCILLLTALLVQVQHSAGCVCVRANETHDRQLHEHQGHLSDCNFITRLLYKNSLAQ